MGLILKMLQYLDYANFNVHDYL